MSLVTAGVHTERTIYYGLFKLSSVTLYMFVWMYFIWIMNRLRCHICSAWICCVRSNSLVIQIRHHPKRKVFILYHVHNEKLCFCNEENKQDALCHLSFLSWWTSVIRSIQMNLSNNNLLMITESETETQHEELDLDLKCFIIVDLITVWFHYTHLFAHTE